VRKAHITPVIIKYPFCRRVYENPNATYVCLNDGEAYAPCEIEERSVCIDDDISVVLKNLRSEMRDKSILAER